MTRTLSILVGIVGVWVVLQGGLNAASADTRPEISNIRIGYDGERTRVVIDATRDLDFSQFALSSGGMRYVLDFDRLDWRLPDQAAHQGEGDGAGGIQRFRYAHNSPTTSRLVFDLDEPLIFESSFTMAPAQTGGTYRIVIDFQPTDLNTFKSIKPRSPNRAVVKPAEVSTPVILPARSPAVEPQLPSPGVSDKYIVVIDAGHGGRDPGAQGIKGTREKDVNLAAALKLRQLLEASGRYDVVLTRESDVLIDHEERIEIARNANADIFISIHADAAGNRAVSGASVYTLSAAGDKRVDRLIDDKGWSTPLEVEPAGDAAKDILQDFIQRETLTKSSSFADILIPELEKVGPILRNSHRQGNLAVLLAPDVPAVLLEVGFLTNPNDEKRLISQEGLSLSMEAVKSAIDIYFKREEQIMAQYISNAG